MPTLRRILKYMPATLASVLLVTWILSWFIGFTYATVKSGRLWMGSVGHASINASSTLYAGPPLAPKLLGWHIELLEAESAATYTGRPLYLYHSGQWGVGVPILVAITGLLPFAIGPFLSFRFRLWHYLAYTALVAVELTYYLRWQE